MKRRKLEQPIPKHAKRVFQGIVFDVYHWRQKLFDGSSTTFEALRRRDSVTVVPVTVNGNILLLREKQPGKPPFIAVPGGIIDSGETPREAAHRELLEETGHSPQKLVPWFSYQPAGRVDWIVHLFIARGCRKTRNQHLDGGEKITVKPVIFDEFIRYMRTNPRARNQEIVMKVLRASLDRREMTKLRRTILG